MAVLVVRSRVQGSNAAPPLVDLQYRLVRAVDAESAYERALELGHQVGHSYPNVEGEQVSWEFIGLHDLREVDDEQLSDGTEVYGHVVRGEPSELAVPKERLSVFWTEANKHRTAREILESK